MAERIQRTLQVLEEKGRIQIPLEKKISWPEPPTDIQEKMKASMRLLFVQEVMAPMLVSEMGPMVLELFRQYHYEIEVSAREIDGKYEKYVFTQRGPVRRIYTVGKTHKPKRKQIPDTETVVSLEELLVRADSAVDFEAKVYYFLGTVTGQILGNPRRIRHL